ncbi:hypothetical protein ZOSMA_68G00760 [Zostera marina]|uniref:Uncharacterized protein n=1 Tax=Zostera marina TaxID=29655 RepID=A0A0K9NRT1_ZOSMR|nr:hypothetical protein ZOSMA_68G00760 [Zostera marina]
MSSNRCSLQKYKNDYSEKPKSGANSDQKYTAISPSSTSAPSAKGVTVHPYSAAVAQRALFMGNRRRNYGRKTGGGNKDAKLVPSRLSKVSLANES